MRDELYERIHAMLGAKGQLTLKEFSALTATASAWNDYTVRKEKRMKIANTISACIMFLTGLFLFGFSVYARLKSPDMSETRLLLEHWEVYGIGAVIFIVSTIAMEVTRAKGE